MAKLLRIVSILVLCVSTLCLVVSFERAPRDFRTQEWRRYVRRAPYLGDEPDDHALRPLGAWSPRVSQGLLALHLAVTLTLALRAALLLMRMRAVRVGAPREDSPYRRAPGAAPDDVAAQSARRVARGELLAFGLAAALPCATSMREVIVLDLVGEVVHATPTQIGWYHDVTRTSRDTQRSIEAHGVRAVANLRGRVVSLEAPCGFELAMSLDSGSLGDGAIRFVVWPAFPSVHQIGSAPVVGPTAGWAHVVFLAAVATWWAVLRDERRRVDAGEA